MNNAQRICHKMGRMDDLGWINRKECRKENREVK